MVGPTLSAEDPFTEQRPLLLGLAYRMLGSLTDAEDVVQEAWLRWSAADRDAIFNPAAWLTTVTTRLSIDRTRTLRRRRESYVGSWLPEPVATGAGPEQRTELSESLTLGFLVLMDTLTPTERAVFLLADIFAVAFADIAVAVGKSEDACRQIASRARRKVRDSEPPTVVEADRSLLERLVSATLSGDVAQVVGLLDPEVVWVSDGGPNRHAARRPVRGADRVARLAINLMGRLGSTPVSEMVINSRRSLVVHAVDGLVVAQAEEREGRISVIRVLLNPDKLSHLEAVTQLE